METVLKKIFFMSTELSKMQEFLLFTQNVHKLSKCTENDCEIEKLLDSINEWIFNEELSFDERRIFFTDNSLKQVNVFSAMFNLHAKGKENVEKIEDLITHSASVIEEQKKTLCRVEEINIWEVPDSKKNRFHYWEIVLVVIIIF